MMIDETELFEVGVDDSGIDSDQKSLTVSISMRCLVFFTKFFFLYLLFMESEI